MILITGGLGYIGSHIAVQILEKSPQKIILIDNLSNSSIDQLDKIRKIVGDNYYDMITFYKVEMLDLKESSEFERVFAENEISWVIHCAGLKSVPESVKDPLTYYDTNIRITINLLLLMEKYHVKNLIFSSSATVYGTFSKPPYKEEMITGVGISNPYGKTKYFIEEIIKDHYHKNPDWCVIIFRYFNPISSHSSGLIPENPKVFNNLFPYIYAVHTGQMEKLIVYGNDYDTSDGTCERDFIHVIDLANAHVCGLSYDVSGVHIFNVSTGNPVSVLQLITTFEEVNYKKLNYVFGSRRDGDIDVSYADNSKIKNDPKFQWTPLYGIKEMVRIHK
jgi:UDP-glucose 4-epimerase